MTAHGLDLERDANYENFERPILRYFRRDSIAISMIVVGEYCRLQYAVTRMREL